MIAIKQLPSFAQACPAATLYAPALAPLQVHVPVESVGAFVACAQAEPGGWALSATGSSTRVSCSGLSDSGPVAAGSAAGARWIS